MNYKQTVEFLFNQLPAYHRVGKAAYKGDLINTIALDDYFGNPHRKYPSVHIAGTNGKGSVSHMVASVLQEAGYRTGLYTSPHLRDFRERIRINGEMIPETAVIDFVSRHKTIIEDLKPSFFEMTVAMAFEYFKVSAVEVAVIEVGLGGRLDSTNIINPVLSVITNIGHDHMDLLGNTLEKIAIEKAGIIKKAVPVVISETQDVTKDIFKSAALAAESSISFADTNFSCFLHETDNLRNEREYTVTDLLTGHSYEGTTVLCGDYQARNLIAVFCSVLKLRSLFRISNRNISDGIRNVILNTGFAGRWQILNHDPLIICDTAHNREGLESVLNQIRQIPKSDLHIILGFVNDKDLDSVLPLFPVDAKYYFTRASVPRALDENTLRSAAAKYGLYGESFHDVLSALKQARSKSDKSDLIFVGGSTFVVAEVV
ncbi:MAG: bifunctional folylpolyglutamate synthase/dihydrofolate synthase [Bacteroidales bacterium]|nr:bifunctional folylpolyglutamate synthase/dihydrofolate synthase [Bacteroidales bacterium]